ncbi:MAG: 3-deoxy-7-phosphoheptulonate synthase [bacterium]|nr:3-deoxy-7-phosphoheptulonate synthase [bacterium]
MQIIMRSGPDTEENVRCIRAHLEAIGSPVSIRNGTGPVVIDTPDMRWGTIIAVRTMNGIERIVTGSKDIDDTNIAEITRLDSPRSYRRDFSADPAAQDTVRSSRDAIRAILNGTDSRFMVVVGPCSIHDDTAGLEYAQKLAKLSEKVRDRILIVMRVYFEKPRTTVGWEGLIQDPYLDESFDMAVGLVQARGFLLRVLGLGLPTATEFVDPITPQYISDLVSWGAIGARSAEAQAYRRMASGLSMPIAFKNGTGGSVQLAVNGVVAARAPHPFLGVDLDGRVAQIKTLGNPDCFVVLRGSSRGTNYDESSIKEAVSLLKKAGVCPNLMVDCSHDNSQKDHRLQRVAFEDVVDQRAFRNRNIVGAMVESNLFEGKQDLRDPKQLRYGVSITDACIGWEETEGLVLDAHAELAGILQ